ncbi:serine/threonine-protein kinase Genghis Khan-like isoform X2 [Amphibalanus amphitrite]|uniref:serine/threonine-protein kinase Genghis Khan-like isoform X2 n=1 Tax=Amphibalanus amphitrite TaxID=1232801 RepID=UPI001C91F650|nr:serine/threonine-protein kinase Genghis Khan-like isoform X2 [Amphibalanus amphitrite]
MSAPPLQEAGAGPEARLRQLEQLVLAGAGRSDGLMFSAETLLDVLVVLFDECSNSSLRREKTVSDFIEFARPVVQRVKSLRLCRDAFEILKVIGRGAFGEVCVVKMRSTEKVFAMKILNKWEMLKRVETACFQEERDVLVYGDRRWITDLHYAFQDDNNLYLVMDYYCGGDLLTLLAKFADGIPESMAKFYITEMVLAIDSIHKLRYVHRDIKPDNVLLDANGHIRLADFGSCLRLSEDGTVQSNVAVGTPDYISPEILRAMEDNQGRYGPECDWWSLGVCMYEMLYAETPFYAESLVETYGKIMNHSNCLDFPSDVEVSDTAKDLLKRLICAKEYRLGQNGIDDFKSHPWFVDIDWDTIRDSTAPYVPEVSSPCDTSNFDVDDLDVRSSETLPPVTNAFFTALHLPFVGFTFTQGSRISDEGCLISAPSSAGADALDELSRAAFERRIHRLEQENRDLSRRLADTTRTLQAHVHGPLAEGAPSVDVPDSEELQTLKDQLRTLQTHKHELELQLAGERQQTADATLLRQELDTAESEASSQRRELERSLKVAAADRDGLRRELQEAQEKLQLQGRELADALSQRKLAMSEYAEVSDKLSELRAQKQKLSRQVRDKEEEVETSMQKLDALRQDIRRGEKLRRELEARCEQAEQESARERRQRQRAEETGRATAEELELLRQRSSGPAPAATDSSAELQRLKAELERAEVDSREALLQHQSRTAKEVARLTEQVSESRAERDTLLQELSSLKERQEQVRHDAVSEKDEALADLRRRHDHEKLILQDENQKLIMDIDRLSETLSRLQAEKRQRDDELDELRAKKESVSQWESQISEIISWVGEEKDARGYLQALASKMTEELEMLKVSGGSAPATEKNWRNRRSQKLDKMELLTLQSSLQSEIQAKQSISGELSHCRAELIASQKAVGEYRQTVDQLTLENRRKDEQLRELQQRLATGEGFLDRSPSQMSFLDQFLKEPPLRRAAGGSGSVASEEAEADDSRVPSIASSKSEYSIDQSVAPAVQPPQLTPKYKFHQFRVRTFSSPLKCNHCTSLMVGLTRQGVVCEVCGFSCHIGCKEKVPAICPVPADQTKRPLGIDPTRGVGTAYEGYVKVPKPGGVKKGWMRQFVVVCDFKLFLYDISPDKSALPSVFVSQVLDMRDENFEVTPVKDNDVIHANKRDLACIFRITTSLMDPPGLRNHTLMLAETETEKTKWVVALNELHRILRRNKLPERAVFRARQLLEPALTLIKSAMSAAIIDPDRLVVGTDEALYCVDLDREEIARVGDTKKIWQLEYLGDEQLMVVLAGKQRQLRLVPVRALDADEVEWTKVSDTKGCITFATGLLKPDAGRQAASYCLCVAVKRQVIIYEINRNKGRHRRLREILLPAQPQSVDVLGEGRLAVGFPSGFTIYSLTGDAHPQSLVHPDSQTLEFLAHNPVDALCCIQLPRGEYLLVFSSLAVYVGKDGRKSREREILFPAVPVAVAYSEGQLLVYSDTQLDVFEASSGDWVQTLNVRRARPLGRSGRLSLAFVSDLPHVVYLSHMHRQPQLINVESSGPGRPAGRVNRRRFSVREHPRAARTGGHGTADRDRRSKMISLPSNFNHVSHMGPGDGIQIQRLMDLPTTLETADQAPAPAAQPPPAAGAPPPQPQPQAIQRVRSMFQPAASGGRGAEPPRRSVSHTPGHPAPPLIQHPAHLHQPGAGPQIYQNVQNGRRPAPLGPPPAPPGSRVRSPDGASSGSGSLAEQVLMSVQRHDRTQGLDDSPRHSIASNNSSNLSSPPSPARDRGSSSYES